MSISDLFTRIITFSREMSKMRKENRKKEHLIKSLQADARKKEVILRRKQDEVSAIASAYMF